MTTTTPLAHRMRPADLDGFCGQEHLLGAHSALRRVLDGGDLHSMIFWGPPGTGKTTLAMMLAHQHNADFVSLSAVSCGVKDIREVVAAAASAQQMDQRQTVLFIDEVHRFNKSQQDAFLPHIENGTIIFVGATTENPSFALNNALLSRARVYILKSLDRTALKVILSRASGQLASGELDAKIALNDAHLEKLAGGADGDARRALGLLELVQRAAVASGLDASDAAALDAIVDDALSGQLRRFDHGGDEFYDQISALHKSVRGSDPDASLYWLCRMLDGGCDPAYVLRRVVRMASEDIGNADPRALWVVCDCAAAFERLGMPEGELAIAQAVIYLACAPKSNAVYSAYKEAMATVRSQGSLPVPDHLRNAPTRLAKQMGHGANYQYAHDHPGGYVPGVDYFPEQMSPVQFYKPVNRGLEIQIGERIQALRALNNQVRKKEPRK